MDCGKKRSYKSISSSRATGRIFEKHCNRTFASQQQLVSKSVRPLSSETQQCLRVDENQGCSPLTDSLYCSLPIFPSKFSTHLPYAHAQLCAYSSTRWKLPARTMGTLTMGPRIGPKTTTLPRTIPVTAPPLPHSTLLRYFRSRFFPSQTAHRVRTAMASAVAARPSSSIRRYSFLPSDVFFGLCVDCEGFLRLLVH